MNIEDVENTMGLKLEITKSDEENKGIVTFVQVFVIILITLIGYFVQEKFGFGNQVILWLIFASIFTIGRMLLSSLVTPGNIRNDILWEIHKELKEIKAQSS